MNWISSPANLRLSTQQIHLWRIVLPLPEVIKTILQGNLSTDELARAKSFRFIKDQDMCAIARGGLRNILSRYTHAPPEGLSFGYTKFGKPYLQGSNLKFNVAHSYDCILYAVSQDIEVGIDVELLKDSVDALGLAEHFFTDNEYKSISALSGQERTLAFFKIWTRKEAILKLTGKGLSTPLNQVEVGYLSTESEFLSDAGKKTKCKLKEINPLPGYVGAVATNYDDCKDIKLWDWNLESGGSN